MATIAIRSKTNRPEQVAAEALRELINIRNLPFSPA
tara:strand:- start:1108 stop:1215 length:108 start_codon:yes stop_codon:yes gene_type:complete